MYAIDENQALLQESHRLRDENIALNAQLQKISAMLQALKVKDLTSDLHRKGVFRAQSQLDGQREVLGVKYRAAASQIEGELTNQSLTIKGLLNSYGPMSKSSYK